MPRVVISGSLHDDGMAVLKARPDVEIESLPDARPETFIERLPAADALILRTAQLPAEALVNARRLKVVARTGVGYDNVPLEMLTALHHHRHLAPPSCVHPGPRVGFL